MNCTQIFEQSKIFKSYLNIENFNFFNFFKTFKLYLIYSGNLRIKLHYRLRVMYTNEIIQESMEQWMKAIACASYDYMKLMVAELQRQLDSVEEETMVPSSSEPPKPPPRQRHNPFNRPESHHRSQSVRSAPGRTENMPRTKLSFRELHTSYGRRILADLNEWRHAKRNSEAPLIIL